MLQLVSLIKQGDVDRSGEGADAGPRADGPAGRRPVILAASVEPTRRAAPVDPAVPARRPGPAERPVPAVRATSAGRSAPVAAPPDEDLSDAGMSTVEYAVGTVAAAAFAAVLYQIVTGGSVLAGLTELINRAMSLF